MYMLAKFDMVWERGGPGGLVYHRSNDRIVWHIRTPNVGCVGDTLGLWYHWEHPRETPQLFFSGHGGLLFFLAMKWRLFHLSQKKGGKRKEKKQWTHPPNQCLPFGSSTYSKVRVVFISISRTRELIIIFWVNTHYFCRLELLAHKEKFCL